jgi:hypothetical protein
MKASGLRPASAKICWKRRATAASDANDLVLKPPSVGHTPTPLAAKAASGSSVASQRLDDHGVNRFRRIFCDPLQRHPAVIADDVDMGVDQPRQYSRIAVIEQLTIGRWLVPHRLSPDNATILEEHRGTAEPEIFTHRRHGLHGSRTHRMATQPTGACQRAPMQEANMRRLSFSCERL